MGRPRFRLMPHWIPGTIARTIMEFMPIRTKVLLSSVVRDRSKSRARKHSSKKNTPIMTLGMPSFFTSSS